MADLLRRTYMLCYDSPGVLVPLSYLGRAWLVSLDVHHAEGHVACRVRRVQLLGQFEIVGAKDHCFGCQLKFSIHWLNNLVGR
jgi:hypothetical protein